MTQSLAPALSRNTEWADAEYAVPGEEIPKEEGEEN